MLLIASGYAANCIDSGKGKNFIYRAEWPLLADSVEKSSNDLYPEKSVSDVEIWLVQKTELSWLLRSDAKIERLFSCRKAALSEIDFFNRIFQKRTFQALCPEIDRPLESMGQLTDTQSGMLALCRNSF